MASLLCSVQCTIVRSLTTQHAVGTAAGLTAMSVGKAQLQLCRVSLHGHLHHGDACNEVHELLSCGG